jgi:hypothetical protein
MLRLCKQKDIIETGVSHRDKVSLKLDSPPLSETTSASNDFIKIEEQNELFEG